MLRRLRRSIKPGCGGCGCRVVGALSLPGRSLICGVEMSWASARAPP
jgi:hypothetical protein